MAVLGKRKAPEPAVSQEDANEIFRRHFESRFEPLEASKKKSRTDEEEESDDDDDEQSGDESEEEQEDEWGGLSDDEISDDDDDGEVHAVEVVDHSSSQAPNPTSMSKRELKAFMSSRPPDQTAKPKDDAESTTVSSKALPEDAPSLLAQDLELRRLLAESHLLSRNRSTSAHANAVVEPKSFATGRTRQKATDLRIQALGSGVSIHAQEKMPMNMRKGMVAAAGARESKRRREARENGVILEREVGKKKRRDRGSGGDVHRPGVGRLKGAELRISERDVKGIEGGRDVFGRRGKR